MAGLPHGSATGGDDPHSSLFTELNDSFHRSYSELIQQARAQLGQHGRPVIVVFRDKVTLFHDGTSETAVIIPELYHRIKAISHVSFGLYITLTANGIGPLRDQVAGDLIHKRDVIGAALAVLDQEPIPPTIIDLQRRTLANALALCEDVLAAGDVSPQVVLDFCAANADLYLESAAIGADLELDLLHEVITAWQGALGSAIWDGVYVVICAAHQARYRETTRQYFMRLLHEEEGEGAAREDRVVYGENIRDLEEALNLLARHLVDQRASLEFFSSRTRLQRDLMADGAARHLDKLFPR